MGRGRAARAPGRARSAHLRARRSFRRTPRWPRCCTASSASTRRCEGWERVYDLYCGIGTIALTLAPRAGRGVGDRAGRAGRRRRDRRAPGATRSHNAHFFAGRHAPGAAGAGGARRADRTCSSSIRRAPGCREKVRAAASSRPRPRRIVYVSCNPTTLAPNAAELVQAGWSLTKVRPVDMFPQTHHIECVALFERDDGRRISASSVARVPIGDRQDLRSGAHSPKGWVTPRSLRP